MSKRYLMLMVVTGFVAACSGPKMEEGSVVDTLVVATPSEEWISLFDGQTFNGWSKYGGGEVGKAWKIENGEIYLDAANKAGWQTGDGGDIVTNEEFENFHFKYEWKIAPNGNSGVIFLVH